MLAAPAVAGPTPTEAEMRRDWACRKILDGDLVRGWEEMAAFVGRDERTLRQAYKDNAQVRAVIHNNGVRPKYWADAAELSCLQGTELWLRLDGSDKKAAYASGRARGKRARFTQPA
jgi:hypothetical protein